MGDPQRCPVRFLHQATTRMNLPVHSELFLQTTMISSELLAHKSHVRPVRHCPSDFSQKTDHSSFLTPKNLPLLNHSQYCLSKESVTEPSGQLGIASIQSGLRSPLLTPTLQSSQFQNNIGILLSDLLRTRSPGPLSLLPDTDDATCS